MADPRYPQDPGRLGYPQPGYGRGYGRDFGGGGRDQGFDGSWGQGYGASHAPSDYRAWMDPRAEAQGPQAGPHAGKGPKGWTRSDARLKEQVSEALMQDRLLDARGVEVEVEGGVVTLNGSVAAPSGVRLAETIVRRCGGVKAVTNNLAVQAPATPDERAPLGVETGANSPLEEGQHDAGGREEGPRHFPKLAM
ncbi:MAG TPA: BON domain-containing protein [Phenylobacterium sp.]|uniref:BON domain-containing protein n=1 Tax=Phenylobacterium sp. TaxID=1871053 RepID=UPI002B8A43EE|nr:BON domain-containing protein [Phenylobacterium sp.]HSV01806.1 BON domain-containing protein [Phenylobacterium sp.]